MRNKVLAVIIAELLRTFKVLCLLVLNNSAHSLIFVTSNIPNSFKSNINDIVYSFNNAAS